MIDGQDISDIRTRKTMYDNDCVSVTADNKQYLMPASTIIQMVNEYNFKTEKKKIHTYLVEAQPKDE